MNRCSAEIAISNVLLTTDFSEESVQAIDCARGLCDQYGATLHVVHVRDSFPYALSADADVVARIEEIRQKGKSQMREFVRAHHLNRKRCGSTLIAGGPSVAIAKCTRKREINLVVLGSRGTAGRSRLFDGSMAEEIFRTAQCPVIVVGPKARVDADAGRFGRLLFATDQSRASRAAIPYIEFLLHENPSSKLTVAHFAEEECVNVYERHQVRKRLERELTEMVDPGLRGQIEDVAVDSCAPNEGMVRMADGFKADLLVLGVRSGGAFTRAATHGRHSIAARVISGAPCPVLTVRAA
jgi:nucleotide-binding universal stress UspA family protein